MFELNDKVALITGASKGIGKAIAMAMSKAGARVVISSRKRDACELVAEEIRNQGSEALVVSCNIKNRDDLRSLVDRTIDEWGVIDHLVCNAAINPYFGPLKDITDEAFDAIMLANVKHTLWLCNMVILGMAARGGGSVLIVSSVAAFKGTTRIGACAISKAADIQIIRNLAVEWAGQNVRVNGIAPGIVKTDFARAIWQNPETYRRAVAAYPVGRLGEPEDISGAAVFLASPAAGFITGQTLIIDGGAAAASGQYS